MKNKRSLSLYYCHESHSSDEALWIIGFRINPDNVDPEVYTLIVQRDKYRPLVVNGQIVFFSKPHLANRALELAEPDIKRLGPAPKDVALVCDVAKTLHLVESGNIDPSATIVNCLNTLGDLVADIGLPMPTNHKRILNTFADHLTFNRKFGNFLVQENISRSAIIDAILWCIGTIVSKARFILDRGVNRHKARNLQKGRSRSLRKRALMQRT